jgi:hypothetical protein
VWACSNGNQGTELTTYNVQCSIEYNIVLTQYKLQPTTYNVWIMGVPSTRYYVVFNTALYIIGCKFCTLITIAASLHHYLLSIYFLIQPKPSLETVQNYSLT